MHRCRLTVSSILCIFFISLVSCYNNEDNGNRQTTINGFDIWLLVHFIYKIIVIKGVSKQLKVQLIIFVKSPHLVWCQQVEVSLSHLKREKSTWVSSLCFKWHYYVPLERYLRWCPYPSPRCPAPAWPGGRRSRCRGSRAWSPGCTRCLQSRPSTPPTPAARACPETDLQMEILLGIIKSQ